MSTVTNTVANAGETRSKESTTAARPNPTAVEIPVNASGTRPKSGGTERELFSEDTETVLTFEDGAVIRLLATVTPGQLIFLTNLVTKQEVVCEVLRKRLLRPAGCYVELRFTERKKGFWEVPAGVAAEPAAKRPQAGDSSKKSLEALVSEVQELLAKKPAPEKTNSARGVGPDDPEATSMNRAAAETTPMDQEEEKAARVETDDATEDLLPKPELDFSQLPTVPTLRKHDSSLLQKPIPVVGATTRKLAWALLAVALVGIGARYGHWIDFLSRSKAEAVQPIGQGESVTPAQSTPAGLKDAATKTEGAAETRNKTAATATPAAGRTSERSAGAAEKERSENAESQNAEEPARRMNESSLENEKEQQQANAEGARRANSKTSATVQAELPKGAEIAGEGSLTPAKLLKLVNPVYPPDAMRNFITGDVKAEVEVGPTGRAGQVKVLSGPTSLREAAVDAVKRYEFSPATRSGKAVASKVIVTVKFWFNP